MTTDGDAVDKGGPGGTVTLSEAIGELRRELADAVSMAQGEEVRFEVGEVSIELSLTVEREFGAKGGVKFWVVDAEVSGSSTRSSTHTITISLTPRTSDGKPLLTGRG